VPPEHVHLVTDAGELLVTCSVVVHRYRHGQHN